MATKGPKTGTAKPAAAPKPAARASKQAAPKVEAAAAAAEKPAPVAEAETHVPAPAPEPVPALEAASQETETTIETVAEPIEAAAETVNEAAAAIEHVAAPALVKEARTMETTIENNTVKAQAFFADINERTKAAVEKSTKLVEEANEFAKGNLEAVVESSRIAAKGFEALGQEAAEYSRKSFESATAALKTLAAVKSPTEFFKLQSDYVRSAFDSYVAETSKNTEAVLKLAGDAAQPISNRFAVAVEKAKVVA
ncbi:MAG: phasin family protein [Sphingomonas sp.]|uniref:phasin family protein n=1 Tax=Sphingomonas sp. TaxID=28214 RepID=UPI001B111F7E|nr:phasin family protein [Sphingomonas sp.]MBO9622239.1 phasin family protein [Sphingomonas sp.]